MYLKRKYLHVRTQECHKTNASPMHFAKSVLSCETTPEIFKEIVNFRVSPKMSQTKGSEEDIRASTVCRQRDERISSGS